MAKSKLHELLAVLSDLEGTAKKVREEAIVTFTKKANHFMGGHKTLIMFDEARKGEEAGAEVHQPLTTTVNQKLAYTQKSQVKYLDAFLQQESTNQAATADLIIGEEIILKDAPATFLLGLENRLKNIRGIFAAIPTLNPAIEWIDDPAEGKDIFRSKHPETAQKQEKVTEPVILYEATKEHPAQVKEVSKNIVSGTFSTVSWSGMITPGKKSEYLSRIDILIQATKKARQRANATEVVKRQVGANLFKFILGD